MNQNFHPSQSIAVGVRLRAVGDDFEAKRLRSELKSQMYSSPLSRLVSVVLTLLLFFSSGPVLFASMARDAMAGGGAGSAGGKGGAANLQNAGAASAALTASRAREVIKQTDAQVAAMKALQASARAIMTPSSFNGLDPNGLVPSATVKWNGATLSSGSSYNVNIVQNKQNAYLYWDKFNVGSKTTVNFDQSAGGNDVGTWIAFNKVMGNVKTDIFGSITAQGQVYILNQNGILFHNGSQVNTHGLVASALPINTGLAGSGSAVGAGVLNLQKGSPVFLFDVANGTAGGDVIVESGATLSSPGKNGTGGRVALIGKNVYNNGTISTPEGQVILAAGNQVGLSAHNASDPTLRGLDVFVGNAESSGTAVNNGLIDIPRGSVSMAGKSVQQAGVIDSSTSVSLNGRVDLISEYGAIANSHYDPTIQGSTPFLFKKYGTVDISGTTRILPEWNSTETAPGRTLTLPSIVNVNGDTIHMSGSGILLAPGARVQTGLGAVVVSAGDATALTEGVTFNAQSGITLDKGATVNVAGSTEQQAPLSENYLKLQLRGGELADSPLQRSGKIRGVDITVDARISGINNGQYWIGTPLGDATGFQNLIYRKVGELTVEGGSISMVSQKNAISVANGSTVDVSGGWLNYAGGYGSTTKLIYQGHLVDISQATPDRVYSGVYSGGTKEVSTKWGVTKTYGLSPLDPNKPHFDAPYLSGANAGYINLSAPTVAMDGTLLGNTVTGPRQLRTSLVSSLPPVPGSLALTISDINVTFTKSDEEAGQHGKKNLAVSAELLGSHGFGNLTIIDYTGNITVPSDVVLQAPAIGAIQVNGVAKPGSSIFLSAANITVDGSIVVPGGKIALNAYTVSPAADAANTASSANLVSPLPPSPTAGTIALGGQALLSTAGLVINDRTYAGPIVLDGGSETDPTSGNPLAGVSISAFRAELSAGSTIDVSGGAFRSPKGIVYGDAGSISIATGTDPANGSFNDVPFVNTVVNIPPAILVNTPKGGYLHLNSTLKGYSGTTHSGSLSLKAPLIQIGGGSSNKDTLVLQSGFFSQGGFAQFSLTGIGELSDQKGLFLPAVYVTPGTVISPSVQGQTFAVLPNTGGQRGLVPFQAAPGYRNPASISLAAKGYLDAADQAAGYERFIRGDIVLGEGSSIATDPWSPSQIQSLTPPGAGSPYGTITISTPSGTVQALGSLISPGGNISITSSSSSANSYPIEVYPKIPDAALVTTIVGSHALISAAGSNLEIRDSTQRRSAPYVSGGSIALVGNAALQSGSILDVSGSTGVADYLPMQVFGAQKSSKALGFINQKPLTIPIDGNGGNISLKGGEMLLSDATLKGFAGGSTALGGSLAVSSGRYITRGDVVTPSLNVSSFTVNAQGIPVPNLFVTQSGYIMNGPSPTIGDQIVNATKTPLQSGHFTADAFLGGGFDALTLGGSVAFRGAVNLFARQQIKVATGGALFADSAVIISAPYVALGTAYTGPVAVDTGDATKADPSLTSVLTLNGQPYYVPPSSGSGSVQVNARLIDVGNVSLQGIRRLTLDATHGEIRGYGTLDMAGDMTLKAGQIYPATDMSFTLAAYDYNAAGVAVASGVNKGSIKIEGGDQRPLPLSAGGSLNVYASSIRQGGTLVAPFGQINLGNGALLKQADGVVLTRSDVFSGINVPATSSLTLTAGSITSVSAVDRITGVSLSLPYGQSTDGKSWIDPTGRDISGGNGIPTAAIYLNAASINAESGSVTDLSGGGSLMAYQWVSGNGGSRDLLGATATTWNPNNVFAAGDEVSWGGQIWSARSRNLNQTPPSSAAGANQYWSLVPQSYAILPGYQSDYAPLAAYNQFNNATRSSLGNTVLAANLGYDPGFSGSMKAGDVVRLAGSPALPAGNYTLLPSRYAVIPGAILMTPSSASLWGGIIQPGGASVASGTAYNALNAIRTTPLSSKNYTLFSGSVLSNLSAYNLLSSSTALIPASRNPLVSGDSAYLQVVAGNRLRLDGNILGASSVGGIGASIDISSPQDIAIVGSSQKPDAPVVLETSKINSWNAGSLVIGGVRSVTPTGTVITPATSKITLDNAGTSLSAGEITLTSRNEITLKDGASIAASGSVVSSPFSINGNGSLLRISSDPNASTTRTGFNSAVPINGFSIGGSVRLSGASLTLDSSGAASIDASAIMNGSLINISAGKIALNFDGSTEANALNLKGSALESLSSSQGLTLTSYSTINFHGSGVLGSSSLALLTLHAGEILGDNASVDSIMAQSLVLDNARSSTDPSGGSPSATGGSLSFTGNMITFGSGAISIGGFQNVGATMNKGIQITGYGSMITAGNLTLSAPLITGSSGAVTSIKAGGALNVTDPGTASLAPGLGASLSLQGSSVSISAPILLPSGSLSVKATTGNLTISSLLDVGGTSRQFFDATQYTDAGSISLSSDNGNLILSPSAILNLSAQPAAGNAGSLTLNAPNGIALMGGHVDASAANGTAGIFTADLGSFNGGNLDPLENLLTSGGFSQSQNIRLRNDPNVSLTAAKAHSYTLSADSGSITVNGTINAAGTTGGSISLFAGQSVFVTPGSLLTVHGKNFDNAGKGGSIDLEAGNNPAVAVIAATAPGASFANGKSVVDLQAGATLDLGVDAIAGLGQASGTLRLRAPQTTDNSDLQINPIAATITGASSINLEGFFRQDAATVGTAAIDNFEAAALNNAQTFMTHFATIGGRVGLPMTPANVSVLEVNPGEEILNSRGGLMLNADWDLSLNRYGNQLNFTDLFGNPQSIGQNAGFLALRAKGDITFNGSLSDGFGDSVNSATIYTTVSGDQGLNLAPLLPTVQDPNNPAASLAQSSWGYRIIAGADLSSANQLFTGASQGSVLVGKPSTQPTIANNYQVIRTGTADIAVVASKDIVLQSELATIYTAGANTIDPTLGGSFVTPVRYGDIASGDPNQGGSAVISLYPAEFASGGGNLNIIAGGTISHAPQTASSQLPINWLQRYSDGQALSWWVDYSNFFEGVGALGGGNVSLVARNQIANIDAVIPTNYRRASTGSKGTELGGGNLSVVTGGDILSGVYYVEKGVGKITAAGSIRTDTTSRNMDANNPLYPELTSLPTTLFAGRASFDVSAVSEITLGPVANPFLLPMGLPQLLSGSDTSAFFIRGYQSQIPYFSTYDSSTSLSISSLSGDVTLRETVQTAGSGASSPMLNAWISNILLPETIKNLNILPLITSGRPWLDIASLDAGSQSGASLLPGTLNVEALGGSVNVIASSFTQGSLTGGVTLAPAASGNLKIIAAKSVNALQKGGIDSTISPKWVYSQLNLSDASPSLVYSGGDPVPLGTSFANALSDSGSTYLSYAIFQTQALLHSPTSEGLHASDSVPLQIYAAGGDISGLTLLSGKKASILAQGNITDDAFYIQNVSKSDITTISAGGNIVLNNASSPLRLSAVNQNGTSLAPSQSLPGDIQISGPGTLEVTAGGTINLGSSASGYRGDSTLGRGITSIGNARNPNFSSIGADMVIASGIAAPGNLSRLDEAFTGFISGLINDGSLSRYLSELSTFESLQGVSLFMATGDIKAITDSGIRNRIELELFYLVLRDAGRDHNKVGAPGYGNYSASEKAISLLFGSNSGSSGDIITSSRDIRSSQGGNISLLAPAGGLTLQLAQIRDATPGLAKPPPGIVTEDGGTIAIYTRNSVSLGISRIFTLHGGDIMIYSSLGDIAAGSSKKTVLSAPPTTVAVDPQSGNVESNLGGLATGGGIGVLAAFKDSPTGNVDLIAPSGAIDAGDAGIRATGNLNLAATKVLNADNIAVSGTTAGAPPAPPPPAAPNVSGATAAAAAGAASTSTAATAAKNNSAENPEPPASIISVEVLGYGGGDAPEDSGPAPTTSSGSTPPPQAAL